MEYMQHERSNVPGNAERKYFFYFFLMINTAKKAPTSDSNWYAVTVK